MTFRLGLLQRSCNVVRPLVVAVSFIAAAGTAGAFQQRGLPTRFDAKVRELPSASLPLQAVAPETLPEGIPARAGWRGFTAEEGGGWTGSYDLRSGLPLLAEGRGIAWVPGRGNTLHDATPVTVERLEALARRFVSDHPLLLGRTDGQLLLDRAATGRLGENAWRVVFTQAVNGVPVEGARFDFTVAHGNLVGFGARLWAPVAASTTPALAVGAARAALDTYLGAAPGELVELEPAALRLVPVDPRPAHGAAWDGAPGAGLAHRLTWRFALASPGSSATWIAHVDAATGEVVAFYDDTKYERIKGGVFPVSNDGLCPTGCEQNDFPMPYAEYTENGGPVKYTGSHGLYNCTATGAPVVTQFNGKYIRVQDNCGAVNQSTTCDNPQDFSAGPGTDCQVPPGASAGDTHSARSSFYHLNRVMEKGRAWLPDNAWLKSQVTDNVNINSTCNAFWNGSVNFYRSGGGCRNTGEIAGVFVHEWGHGIDQNDGGGYDNPSEAYADTVAFLETRVSCVGRGFYMSQNCDGYGDACLNCTGIRDQDWDKHAAHTPATAATMQGKCGGGGGACGFEVHCESYIGAEAIWDLAARDLPAAGLDTASAWQEAEQLFYLSRKGSGGNAYNCSAPNSDGCNANGWFHSLRVADDDDGNLNNGTPHAAAIFAAFNRHKIACGSASDASNQNSGSCGTLAKPVISVTSGTNSATISWTAVPGATSYNILRNDLGCDRAQIIVGKAGAPATSFTDTDLSNGFTVYYRVQAVGAQQACVSPVSDCSSSAPQPFAGTVKFDAPTYACSATLNLQVVDGNVGAPTVTVQLWSTTESTPETVTLNAIAPGASKYVGSFAVTSGPAVHGDGLLSVKNGDALTVQYVDANDGAGGVNVPRQDHATADCQAPVFSGVTDSGTTDTATTIKWATDELSDSVLLWGPVVPPGSTSNGTANTTSHAVPLAGLASCTTYWYEVRSKDPAGNQGAANNGGLYYRFETLGNFGSGLQSCHQGRVSIGKAVASCHDAVPFTVVDLDLNADATRVDTYRALVTSTTEPAGEWTTITETGANTSRFTGSIATATGAPVPDGTLQTSNGDVLTVTYFDRNDGSGNAATAFATAALDCGGPRITGLHVDTITSARGTVHFTTDEPATTTVEFGPTPALGFSASDAALVTAHAGVMNQSDTCQETYFRVRAADQFGNATLLDNHGAPFTLHSWDIPGLYWRDTFENGNAAGWALSGEFEIAPPAGRGGSSGQPDPASAYNDQKVLGDDLTGRGAFPGDYEPSAIDVARTPTLNATTWQHTKLIFERRLQAGNGDEASLWIYGKGGQIPLWRVWTGLFDGDWVAQSFDVSAYFDGQSQTAVEFRQRSDGNGNYSGWTIDDVILKDGSRPDYAPCGHCGAGPSFAGARSAIDNDACAAAGVTVSWDAAPSWGTGGPGTYTVYRGPAPGFPADAAHLVAKGVGGLSYDDASAPAGTLSYLVRAENDETCGTGPQNGGAVDGNAVYVSVQKTTSRPLPGAVSGLTVTAIGKTHVRLTWESAANASSTNVYRSTTPLPSGFAKLAGTGALVYDDLGAAANQERYFYLVRGANPCGSEGP